MDFFFLSDRRNNRWYKGCMYFCGRVKRSKKVVDDGNLTYFIIRYRLIKLNTLYNYLGHHAKDALFIHCTTIHFFFIENQFPTLLAETYNYAPLQCLFETKGIWSNINASSWTCPSWWSRFQALITWWNMFLHESFGVYQIFRTQSIEQEIIWVWALRWIFLWVLWRLECSHL
jgi:hypothetical protein